MTKYKVGDKVWLTTENRYGIITEVEDTPQGIFIHIDNRHSYAEHLIHDTADTMLTRLGFEKTSVISEENFDYTMGNEFIYISNSKIDSICFDKPNIVKKIETIPQLMREMKAND